MGAGLGKTTYEPQYKYVSTDLPYIVECRLGKVRNVVVSSSRDYVHLHRLHFSCCCTCLIKLLVPHLSEMIV